MNHSVEQNGGVSEYREFLPPLALAGHLVCLWTQTVARNGKEHAQRVLPDTCVDLVVINDQAPMVIGPWTEPFVALLSPGTTIVGARFRPGMAAALLGLEAAMLLNQSAVLSMTSRKAVSSRFQRVVDERGPSARKVALETALLNSLPNRGRVDAAVRTAVQWLSRRPDGRVEELAVWIGMSRRQLQRRFVAAVGYGPKMFQSVLRFQRLLHLAGTATVGCNLARIAIEAGYADQAHMTREVRRFADVRPTVLLGSAKSALRLSDLVGTCE